MQKSIHPIPTGDPLGQSPKQMAEGSQRHVQIKKEKISKEALRTYYQSSSPLDIPPGVHPFVLISVSFYTNRLGKFLNTETDVEISAQPDFEDQTLDFSDVEQLMGSINTIPGARLPCVCTSQKVQVP